MSVRARLFSKTGPFAGQSFPIGEEATFGRSADNPVVLADAAVSGRHGRIFWDPEEECYRIEDLGSRNGTWVAGIRVREPEKLGRLDVIGVAGVAELVFQTLDAGRSFDTDLDLAAGDLLPPDLEAAAGAAGRTFADAEPLAVPAGLGASAAPDEREAIRRTIYEDPGEWVLPALEAEEAAPPSEGFFLEVESLESGTIRHPLAPGEHLVGRGAEADVVVESPTLSRAHARLVVDADGVQVIDLGSTNGTRVAGREAEPGTPVAVAPGAELELGSVPCRIVRAPLDDAGNGGS